MIATDACPPLDAATRTALVAYLLAWADDELVLGHRDSEWTGFAPQIEEDVAFSSIAQDELGHAALLYRLVAELSDDDPDRLALRRPAADYRHAALVERPNGDWAHTIARHYLYDLADACRTDVLCDSAYAALAGVARKMVREEHYHLMHHAVWWERLRDGTPESRARLVNATRALLPLAVDLFGELPGEHGLVAVGIVPCPSGALLAEWCLRVQPLLSALDPDLLPLLELAPAPRHSRPVGEDFRALHAEMTAVSASGLGERW
jgi:ring-1,2-phenylacetyl-CoA epoxidase subunit PaaC